MPQRILRKVHRRPVKFDALDVFAAWAQEHGVPVIQKDALARFAADLDVSLKESLATDTMLFGNRTQAMFEAVVANLGEVRLVKREDAGDFYVESENVSAPDTRVVLSDGRNLLIETKNFHGSWDKPFRMKTSYLQQLKNYAALVGCPLRIAIFWSQQSRWTLVAPEVLTTSGRWAEIECVTAFGKNDMGALGDKILGTPFPLRIHSYVQKRGGRSRLRLDKSRFFVGEQEVLLAAQRRLLFFLALWGEWEIEKEGQRSIEETDDRRIVEVAYMPMEEARNGMENSGDGCVLNAWLSTVLSRFWLQLTSTLDGGLATLLPDRGAWTDQLLEVTNEGESVFAILEVASSLDPAASKEE